MILSDYYEQILAIKGWENKRRCFIDYAITVMSKEWPNKNIFIIEAPTGYGKTTISQSVALYSLNEELKCIIAFPLRTLLEDQYCKFIGEIQENEQCFCKGEKGILGNLGHELKRKIIGKRYMHNPDSKYLIKPITLTTIDTLSLTLFGLAPEDLDKIAKYCLGTSYGSMGHYLFSWSSAFLSNIVLDEVHLVTDSTKSINFLFALIQMALENNLKLILMSATVPTVLEDIIMSYFEKWKEKILFLKFGENSHFYDKSFVDNRKNKKYDVLLVGLTEKEKFSRIFEWIALNWNDYKRVIVIFNTVNECINFYLMYKDRLIQLSNNLILLHSRFNENDRRIKKAKLDSIRENQNNHTTDYIIVSTQVIEAGIDISSNLFITDIAPMNSLIQRLGRFLRYENENNGRVYIWYEIDDSNNLVKNKEIGGEDIYKVYNLDLTNRTLEELKKTKITGGKINFRFHLPEDYKKFIDAVYRKDDFKVTEEEINDLLLIHMNFSEGSRKAFEKFLELEGSFVHDSLIIPVIPEKLLDELISRYKKIENIHLRELSSYSVPISFDVIKKLNIIGELYLDWNEEIRKKVLRKKDLNPTQLKNKIRNPKETIRYIMYNSVLSFVTDKNYNSEFGLGE